MEIRNIFLSEHVLKEHFETYDDLRVLYIRTIAEILSNVTLNKSLTLTTKSRIVTVLLHRRDREALKKLYPYLDLPEITKACEILDANRHAKQLTKRLENIKNRRKLSRVTKERDDQLKLVEDVWTMSLTSSKSRLVKTWVRGLTKEQLEYRAMMFPTEMWQRLADLIHLNPKTDFAVDWFLPYCYGAELPKESLIYRAKNVTVGTFLNLYKEYPLPYEFIRLKLNLNKSFDNYQDHDKIDAIKEEIAIKEKMETVLWYWQDLQCQSVNDILSARLCEFSDQAGTLEGLGYGKLVELLMRVNHKYLFEQLVRVTERRLKSYEIKLPGKQSNLASMGPVAILSDASSSMDIAIKTSSIVTSLLCSLTQARLHLFNQQDNPIEKPPKTIRAAIEFAKMMRAGGATSPAASLNTFYTQRIPIKTFIIVTDEEENTSTTGGNNYGWGNQKKGDMFAELYQKYYNEVYPARLIFISFTNPSKDGQMVERLRQVMGSKMIDEFVQTFKFDTRNPDLNRLDSVLQRMTKEN